MRVLVLRVFTETLLRTRALYSYQKSYGKGSGRDAGRFRRSEFPLCVQQSLPRITSTLSMLLFKVYFIFSPQSGIVHRLGPLTCIIFFYFFFWQTFYTQRSLLAFGSHFRSFSPCHPSENTQSTTKPTARCQHVDRERRKERENWQRLSGFKTRVCVCVCVREL